MKAVTIRLPDVEAAMLVEVQKRNKDLRNLQSWLAGQIRRMHDQLLSSK